MPCVYQLETIAIDRRAILILLTLFWYFSLSTPSCLALKAFQTTFSLRHFYRLGQRRPLPGSLSIQRRSSVTMAQQQMDGFFGSDDFLENFDLDAAVAAATANRPKKKHDLPTFRDPAAVPQRKIQQEAPPTMDAFPGLDLDTNTPAVKKTPRTSEALNGASIEEPRAQNKRFKITPSPSTTALHATRNIMENEESLMQQPFTSSNKKFSIGYSTDPEKELATNAPPIQAAPMSSNSTLPQDKKLLTAALQETMDRYFGFSTFRPGQKEVLQAILGEQRDAAVFWATGSGKSLCYQVPPLHTGHVGLVVSPLISLMQDQVNKLNGLSDENKKLATYLGSSQLDPNEEERALRGEYPLVYVTPEKLCSPGFLDRLVNMHLHKKRICLIAIDESHCVSEWGHDFRCEYRALGTTVRKNVHLEQVPLLALTATAVPRVQQDICSSLRLRPNAYIAQQSFDRTNLEFQVFKKPKTGGFTSALQPLVEEFRNKNPNTIPSTIVYVPTIDQVMQISSFLQRQAPKNGNVLVKPYHGKMSTPDRTQAHLDFLVGRTKVIIATVAFGMGIDKPDTRRIIHWGPPKTVEEYYQQVGRAGRDGLPATCTMYATEHDFNRYKSDFYMGGNEVSAQVKRNMEASMDALRSFAFDTTTCRRKALLDFFHEPSPFGERCGTCDTCRNQSKYGGDLQRDFGNAGARVVLAAVGALQGQAIGVIEKVLGAKQVEDYRYQRGYNAIAVCKDIEALKKGMKKKRSISYFRELMTPLVSSGYIKQATRKTNVDGFSRTWGTYDLTPKGREALMNKSVPIILPVPPSLREEEQKQEARRQRSLEQLKLAGVDLEDIPKEEVDAGDGEVIRAYKKWHGHVESVRRNNRADRVAALEQLLGRIEKWRSDTAAKYSMAPVSVLAEHQVASIAYTVATMKPGSKMEQQSLVLAGVRARGTSSLVDSLGEWVDEFQPAPPSQDDSSSATLVLPTVPFAPPAPWEYAVYKPNKKTGVATWESSHKRFLSGAHPQTIAMSPENGRPIQVATVVGHILDGLTQGRPVPLRRLAEASSPPTKADWEELERLEAETGMNVTGDPSTSGMNGEAFRMTEFLRPVMGDDFIETPYNERTEEDKTKFSKWCEMLKWYMALRRSGYGPVEFDDAA